MGRTNKVNLQDKLDSLHPPMPIHLSVGIDDYIMQIKENMQIDKHKLIVNDNLIMMSGFERHKSKC